MTGAILAMARGAGEVAPLMLVGAVKLAPELPIDSASPPFGVNQSFMHLGFHIYDLGFQSSELGSEQARCRVHDRPSSSSRVDRGTQRARPSWLRSRMRRRFEGNQF